jgi:hypothetical protein
MALFGYCLAAFPLVMGCVITLLAASRYTSVPAGHSVGSFGAVLSATWIVHALLRISPPGISLVEVFIASLCLLVSAELHVVAAESRVALATAAAIKRSGP